MKILMTCSVPAELGTFIRLLRYGNALSRRGHSVTLVRQGHDNRWKAVREIRNGVTIIHSPRLGGDPWLPKTIRPNDIVSRISHVLRNEYDVHHAFQEFESVALPWNVSRWFNRAKIHIYDADDLWVDGGYLGTEADHRGIWRWHYNNLKRVEKHTRTTADGMTVVSEFLRDRAINFGMNPDRILLLRPGIECQDYQSSKKSPGDFGLPDKPIVAFTGFGQQDIKEAISICRHAIQQGCDLHFLLVGPDITNVRKLAEQHRLNKQITITGAVPPGQVSDWLAFADVAILPYPDTLANRSRWPTKLSDYLALGLPTLVGPAGKVGTEIESMKAGRYYTSIEEAATILCTWVRNDSELKSMQSHAQQAAEMHYNINLQAEQLERFYQSLIES